MTPNRRCWRRWRALRALARARMEAAGGTTLATYVTSAQPNNFHDSRSVWASIFTSGSRDFKDTQAYAAYQKRLEADRTVESYTVACGP